MKKKVVIFDMDGVIFDSERLFFEEWKEFAEKKGIKNIEDVYPKCIGTNYATGKRIFLDFYGNDFPYDKYHREIFEEFCKKYGNGKLPLKKGVSEILSFLKDKGYFIAIASSTEVSVVKSELDAAGILSYFDRVIGGDMVRKSKPEPDIFLKAVENLDAEYSDIYVIEDSFNGIRAAAKAGMIPVMVPDMLYPSPEIKQLATYILTSLNDVKEMLSKKHQ